MEFEPGAKVAIEGYGYRPDVTVVKALVLGFMPEVVSLNRRSLVRKNRVGHLVCDCPQYGKFMVSLGIGSLRKGDCLDQKFLEAYCVGTAPDGKPYDTVFKRWLK